MSLQFIDHDEDKIKEIALQLPDIDNPSSDLETYIAEILRDAGESSGRVYEHSSSTTAFSGILSKIVNGDFESAIETASNKLLKVEKDTQERIRHLTEIQKGIFLIALIEYDGISRVVFAKVDHSGYIDEEEYKVRNGFSLKKKIYRICIVEYEKDFTLKTIKVYDANAKPSKYWWQDFFELKEFRSDEHNTEKAFDAIDKNVLNKIKRKYPSDHQILRNNTITFFRNRDDFDLNTYIGEVFKEYEPFDTKLKVEELISKVKALPTKHDFDESFGIKRGVIKAKFKRTIDLTETIHLTLERDIDDKVILPYEDSDGRGIKIRTEKGYNVFKGYDEPDTVETY